MRSPFNMLTVRTDSKRPDFSKIDGFVPPIYRLFAETFVLQRESIHRPGFTSLKDDSMRTCATYTIHIDEEDDQMELYDFFSVDEISEVRQRLYDGQGELKEKGLLPVGSGSHDIIILVGTLNPAVDHVFLEKNYGSRLIKVADNIFQFLTMFKFQELEEVFIKPYKFSQLYKNWGDDTWKVRDEKAS